MEEAEQVIRLGHFDEDEDESFVPDSLKGFFEDADKKLQQDIADVMNFDCSKPKVVSSMGVDHPTDRKATLSAKNDQVIMKQIQHDFDDDDDFMSPPLQPSSSMNPAAFLTHGAARDMALEGLTPFSGPAINLQEQLDQVAAESSGLLSQNQHQTVDPSSQSRLQIASSHITETPPRTAKSRTPSSRNEQEAKQDTVISYATDQSSARLLSHPSHINATAGSISGLAAYAGTRPQLHGQNTSSPTSSETKSPKSTPQKSTSVTQQQPTYTHALEQNNRPTSTVTEIHPKVVSGTKASQKEQENRLPPTTPYHHGRTISSSNTPKDANRASHIANYSREKSAPTAPSLTATPNSQLECRDRHLVAEMATGDDLSPQRPIEISFLPMDSTAPSPLPVHGVTSPLDFASIHVEVLLSDSRGRSSRQASSPPAHPRLLQTTFVNEAKAGSRLTSPIEPVTNSQWKGRKELTSPDKIPSRLLQSTNSSRARFSKIQEPRTSITTTARRTYRPISSRLLKPTQAAEMYLTDSPLKRLTSPEVQQKVDRGRGETKPRVPARIEQQKQKDVERKGATQERESERQKELNGKRQKMQAALARARLKREKIESLEQERRENLKQKLKEKEEKVRQRLAEKENNRLPPKRDGKATTSHSNAAIYRKVTVPVAPTFQTDRRLKNPDRIVVEDAIPLAHSDTFLKQNLRSNTPDNHDFAHRILTIPKGPRLSSGKRHGEVPQPTEPKRKQTWEMELRHTSSPMASDRSTSSRLTIPHTPKFHEIKSRPLPKSTAEKEAEEMEYFNSHPFKARTVRMNDAGSVTKPTNIPPARPLTTPSPFQFKTDQRIASISRCRQDRRSSGNDKKSSTKVDSFKARPVPKSKTTTPLTVSRPTSLRSGTTHEPLHLHSDSPITFSQTPQEEPTETEEPVFRARPMPNFSRPTGITLHRKTNRESSTPLEPDKSSAFEARLTPSLSKGDPPETISTADMREKNNSAGEGGLQFRARPMPSFRKVSIPVRPRDPEKIRASSHQIIPKESEPVLFRARKLPNLSRPSVPVKPRDPSKLRSPENILASTMEKRKTATVTEDYSSETFRARPLPKLSPPNIPVKQRDSSKLRSPGYHKDPPIQSRSTGSFHARIMPSFDNRQDTTRTGTMYQTTPTLSSPTWDPPTDAPTTKHMTNDVVAKQSNKLSAKESLRQRLKGRNVAGASHTNGTRFSIAGVKSRLQRVAPVASPEVVVGRPGTVPTNINSSASNPIELGLADSRNLPSGHNTLEHCEDEVLKKVSAGGIGASDKSSPRQIEKLDDAAEQSEVTYDQETTPRTGTRASRRKLAATPPSADLAVVETRRREQEQEAATKLDEAMKMAYNLQRAAEDELSFHGSINSREQYMTYEGRDFI